MCMYTSMDRRIERIIISAFARHWLDGFRPFHAFYIIILFVLMARSM